MLEAMDISNFSGFLYMRNKDIRERKKAVIPNTEISYDL